MIKRLTPCALLLTLAACPGSDGGTGPEEVVSSVRFSHPAAGAILPAGAYEAVGEVRFGGQGQLLPGEWAFGMVGMPPGFVVRVTASQRSAIVNGRYDVVAMEVPGDIPAGGTAALAVVCNGAPACAQVHVSLGMRTQGNVSPQVTCTLSNGTVTVTARSATRIRGTFAGSGTCYGSAGNAPYQVTGGTFDVPVLEWG